MYFNITTRKAISPAIATIFLIGVAIIGATTAGNGMLKQNEIAQKSARLELVDVTLVKLGTEKTYFAAMVKNVGTIAFSSVKISFYDDVGVFHTINSVMPLDPGEQFGDYLIENAKIENGKKYLVSLDAITTTGSKFNAAKTITARN